MVTNVIRALALLVVIIGFPAVPDTAGARPLAEEDGAGLRYGISVIDGSLAGIFEELGRKYGFTVLGLEGLEERQLSFSETADSVSDLVRTLLRHAGIKSYLLKFDEDRLRRVQVFHAKGRERGGGGVKRAFGKKMAAPDLLSAVKVRGVVAGSQAARLDIREGDFIVEYDGEAVTSSRQLFKEVRNRAEKAQIDVLVIRDREPLSFTVSGGRIGVRIKTVRIPESDIF